MRGHHHTYRSSYLGTKQIRRLRFGDIATRHADDLSQGSKWRKALANARKRYGPVYQHGLLPEKGLCDTCILHFSSNGQNPNQIAYCLHEE